MGSKVVGYPETEAAGDSIERCLIGDERPDITGMTISGRIRLGAEPLGFFGTRKVLLPAFERPPVLCLALSVGRDLMTDAGAESTFCEPVRYSWSSSSSSDDSEVEEADEVDDDDLEEEDATVTMFCLCATGKEGISSLGDEDEYRCLLDALVEALLSALSSLSCRNAPSFEGRVLSGLFLAAGRLSLAFEKKEVARIAPLLIIANRERSGPFERGCRQHLSVSG